MRKLFLWATRHNALLTIGAASVAPFLYLWFIYRDATNSFTLDDWSVVPMIHAALHGQLTLSQLWSQHTESRYFIGNMIDVLFGLVDRFDLRSVIFLSAAILIASYVGLLVLVREYYGKRLTPIPVLLTGVIWFSLADVQNALWAAQLSVFLTVLFFVLMLIVLLVPNSRRGRWFAVGVFCAAAASLATLQGFVCWPVGAICLLWNQPLRARRVRREVATWLGAMVLTLLLYLRGYNFGEGNVCLDHARCTYGLGSTLVHPGTDLGLFSLLIGYVIPGRLGSVHDVIQFEALGVVLFGAVLFILIRSWRERHSRERLPLPLLLIVFSLLVDALITVGRNGEGTSQVFGNRYVIYNLILLAGIVIYALARVPSHPQVRGGNLRVYLKYFALFAFAIFLVIQVATTTGSGLTNGRLIGRGQNDEAEILVRFQLLQKERAGYCQLFTVVYFEIGNLTNVREAMTDRLGEFRPDSVRYYRGLGLPPVPSTCQRYVEASGVGSP